MTHSNKDIPPSRNSINCNTSFLKINDCPLFSQNKNRTFKTLQRFLLNPFQNSMDQSSLAHMEFFYAPPFLPCSNWSEFLNISSAVALFPFCNLLAPLLLRKGSVFFIIQTYICLFSQPKSNDQKISIISPILLPNRKLTIL